MKRGPWMWLDAKNYLYYFDENLLVRHNLNGIHVTNL